MVVDLLHIENREVDLMSLSIGCISGSINGSVNESSNPGAAAYYIGNGTNDTYSKNIQSQIMNKQKELQDLSSQEDLSLEDKMKKRQAIQKEISDLNIELRQHQIEQRKEEQQKNGSSMDDMLGDTQQKNVSESKGQSAGLSKASMQAMISAGSSIKKAKVQGNVATDVNGRIGVIEAEIKLDTMRGVETKKKEEELANIQEKAQTVVSSQISTLTDANEKMQEAAKEEQKSRSKNNDKNNDEEQEKDKTVSGNRQVGYTPIDVRL